MPIKDIPLEKTIEGDFVKGVKKLAAQYHIMLKCRKMNGLGYRSWPDRLVIGPKKFIFWCELKRPVIGKLSDGQKDLFEELRDMDHDVQIHDVASVAVKDLETALHDAGVINMFPK